MSQPVKKLDLSGYKELVSRYLPGRRTYVYTATTTTAAAPAARIRYKYMDRRPNAES